MSLLCSIIIPTYYKQEMLKKNLSHNIKFLKDCEIIIVNDAPNDILKINDFPEISNENLHIISHNVNKGFGSSINDGVAIARSDKIFLLNNDVRLLDDSYKKAIFKLDEDKFLFAVSFAQKEKSGKIIGKNILKWEKGYILHDKASNIVFGKNAWAEGGSAIFDKNKFEKLNGFDELYNPFYWEDIDLSYRAWKRGWHVFFDPEILVEHHHESTIGTSFKKDYVQEIAYRNQYIFQWKNIEDFSFIIKHILSVFFVILSAFLHFDTVHLKGFFKAIRLLPRIFKKRKENFSCESDEKIVFMFGKN